jgi:WD40 repeat protein
VVERAGAVRAALRLVALSAAIARGCHFHRLVSTSNLLGSAEGFTFGESHMPSVRPIWQRYRRSIVICMFALIAYIGSAAILGWIMDVRPRLSWPITEENRIAAFSPDGQWLATYRSSEHHDTDPVRIWRTSDGREHARCLTANNQLHFSLWEGAVILFSPDSQRLVVKLQDADIGSSFRPLKMFNVATGQELFSAEFSLEDCCFSPDGRWLALVRTDVHRNYDDLCLVDTTTGEVTVLVACAKMDETRNHPFEWMGFAPDGATLAYRLDEGQIILWDTKTRKTRAVITAPNAFNHHAFSPDSRWMAATSLAGDAAEVKVWDTRTGNCASELPCEAGKAEGHVSAPDRVLFSRDGARVLGVIGRGGGGSGLGPIYEPLDRVVVWDVASRKVQSMIACGKTKGEALENPSDSFLPRYALRRYRGSGWDLIDPVTGAECLSFRAANPESYHDSIVALSPNGNALAEAHDDKHSPHWLRQWLAKWVPGVDPGKAQVTHTIRWWDLASRSELPFLSGCFGDFAFSPDGQTLAARNQDGTLQLWDVPPRKPLGLILAWSCVSAGLVLLLAWRRGRRLET